MDIHSQSKIFPASNPKKRNVRGIRRKCSKVGGSKEVIMKHVHAAEIVGRWVRKRLRIKQSKNPAVYLFTFLSPLI